MSAQKHRGVSRRTFLKSTGGAALMLSLNHLGFRGPKASAEAMTDAEYRGWEDVYRQQWRWDRVVKGTHYVNCAYQRGCAWNVYVKDEMVWREEQVAHYPRTNATVPDFNPRGCQKGACYSARMYDVSRLRYPLKRVGARGECKWERISWEQALREVADKVIDVLAQSGPGAVVWDVGTVVTNGGHGLGITRTVTVLDTPMLEINTEIGDHYPGATATTGKICFTGSFDDLFYSELILIWGGNPVYTHIPNTHFINEARYKGARVVAIAPDLNPSAIHCDEWVPVNVGTDAALGLSLAQVMVEEDIYDKRFVREQTDLPFLVRQDTKLFLRHRDLTAGGKDDVFYVFDEASKKVVEAPRSSLDLGQIAPALEGEFRVKTVHGEVAVTPVFTLLREHLADYTPEKAGKITGTHPNQIRSLARALAKAKAAAAITQTNFSKFYHGLEMERGQILAFAMAGQIGKKGAGIAAFPYLSIDGQERLAVASGSLPPRLAVIALAANAAPKALRLKLDGYSMEMILGAMARDEYKHGRYLASPLWFYRCGELEDVYGSAQRWDPHL
jgi:anaerobic selenocysteine-containing dehydrogenase